MGLWKNMGKVGKGVLHAGGKAVKGAGYAGVSVAKKVAAAQLPGSVNWLYGFGFKVGVFLMLKTFLAVRYLDLAITGYIVALTQFVMGTIFFIGGMNMQLERSYSQNGKLTQISGWYVMSFLVGLIVCILRDVFEWEFFRGAAAANWLVDFFKGIAKGTGEITMALVFWDIDLWTAFNFMLLLLTLSLRPEGIVMPAIGAIRKRFSKKKSDRVILKTYRKNAHASDDNEQKE